MLIPRVFLLLASLAMAGCVGFGYYPQAISGHLKLMASRQSIDEFLQQPQADPLLQQRAQRARQVLEFAENTLDLPANGAYQRIAITGREAVVWNVVATEEFSLQAKTWCFPVAGCVPYLGYYQHEAAITRANRLKARGLDTTVSGAAAYSSLGWFEDPLLDTFLRQSEPAVAASLIHELAHQKLYVKGDTAFNESFASFVEREGLRQWMAEYGQVQQWQQWLERERARAQFMHLLKTLRDDLSDVYASTLTEEQKRQRKQALFASAAQEHQRLITQQWAGTAYFQSFFDREPNNADLALIGQYEDGICAFKRLFKQADAELQRFYEAAREVSELPDAQRRTWLMAAC